MAAKDQQAPGKGIQTPKKQGPGAVVVVGGLALLLLLMR